MGGSSGSSAAAAAAAAPAAVPAAQSSRASPAAAAAAAAERQQASAAAAAERQQQSSSERQLVRSRRVVVTGAAVARLDEAVRRCEAQLHVGLAVERLRVDPALAGRLRATQQQQVCRERLLRLDAHDCQEHARATREPRESGGRGSEQQSGLASCSGACRHRTNEWERSGCEAFAAAPSPARTSAHVAVRSLGTPCSLTEMMLTACAFVFVSARCFARSSFAMMIRSTMRITARDVQASGAARPVGEKNGTHWRMPTQR